MCQKTIGLVILIAALLVGVPSAVVWGQMPSTDIWVASIREPGAAGSGHGRHRGTGAILALGEPENVTRRIGYDNQPQFLFDGSGFLFTRGELDGTDIYRYDLEGGKALRLTSTPESEYSPTPIHGGGFYTVRVEADSTQRMWRFDADGARPRVVLASVDSVGYFAWLDDRTVALFVVGDPHTLRAVDLETERETVVARDIGRALLRAPGGRGLTCLVREPNSEPPVFAFHTWSKGDHAPVELIAARGAGQDAVWIGEMLVMADGAKLYGAYPFDRPEWTELADLGVYGVAGITRIVASGDCKRIAFVATEHPLE